MFPIFDSIKRKISPEFETVTRLDGIVPAVDKLVAGAIDGVKVSKDLTDMAFMRQLSIDTSARMPSPTLTNREKKQLNKGHSIIKKGASLAITAEIDHFTLRVL